MKTKKNISNSALRSYCSAVKTELFENTNEAVHCENDLFLGPVHMEASQPAYRAGPVGETAFILCSYGEIPARLPRQKLDTCQK